MKVDEKTRKLIAIGASVAVNCQPCMEHHMKEVEQLGISREEIRVAVQVGRNVRQGSGTRFDEYMSSIDLPSVTSQPAKPCCC